MGAAWVDIHAAASVEILQEPFKANMAVPLNLRGLSSRCHFWVTKQVPCSLLAAVITTASSFAIFITL